jgi:hypothetical protein
MAMRMAANFYKIAKKAANTSRLYFFRNFLIIIDIWKQSDYFKTIWD